MIHIEFYCFVIPRMVLDFKYKGGIEQFKLDLKNLNNHTYKEDDHLASVSFLTVKATIHFMLFAEQQGIHYDKVSHCSDDFSIMSWIALWWDSDWLEFDTYRFWMKGSD